MERKSAGWIFEIYADNTTAALWQVFKLGWILLVISALLWVFVLTAVPEEKRPDQIKVPIGATTVSILMIASYPIYRASWRQVVQPKVRAFLEGDRVDGIIESIDDTDFYPGTHRTWESEARQADARRPMKQIRYRYSIDGREVQRTTIPVRASTTDGLVVGGRIPVYVSTLDPEHGEADIFGIRAS